MIHDVCKVQVARLFKDGRPPTVMNGKIIYNDGLKESFVKYDNGFDAPMSQFHPANLPDGRRTWDGYWEMTDCYEVIVEISN